MPLTVLSSKLVTYSYMEAVLYLYWSNNLDIMSNAKAYIDWRVKRDADTYMYRSKRHQYMSQLKLLKHFQNIKLSHNTTHIKYIPCVQKYIDRLIWIGKV